MKRTKIIKNLAFAECRGEMQKCSLCEDKMMGKVGLSIHKPRTDNHGYNVWFCLKCVGKLPGVIEEGVRENRDELILEML